jgi:hypothetical protein
VGYEGDTVPTEWTPYSNICPIEGRTGTTVTRSDGAETDPDIDIASISFGQTVYGGQVDFVTGKVRVTHGIAEFDGSNDENWLAAPQPNMLNNTVGIELSVLKPDGRPNVGQENGYVVCDMFESPVIIPSADSRENKVFHTWNWISVGTSLSASDFKAWLSSHPINVVYELATPIELTLTPAQLSLLQGTNILTADGTINLTYLGSMASNVQSEINEFESATNNLRASIAFVESTTAKTSHAVGDYIILNDMLCKVIAGISTGETITIGTNVKTTTLGAELRAIWAEISA